MAILLVSYPAGDGARFDRSYYVATHLPLVRRVLEPHGLVGAEAYFPDDQVAPMFAVAVLRFADAAARDAVLGHPDAGHAFADIPNFTDVQPAATRMSAA
ncbi:EthD family reductase [Sphingomonas lenta]|uniref:EthD family reductase n=1 Tax=Sphingomonas lenta TaxID=1141887 RepID=UPI001FE8D0D0|nr:EthD family reductase [Sphingomonas lenta]